MWSVHFFPFLFLFLFFFHWESFLLRWLHWDKQQRNLIKWMPGVMTLSKHAAALSINQRMLKKILTLLHMSIGELWMQLWMDRGLCVALWAPAYKEEQKRRQVSRTMATHHVVLVHVMGLSCDDSPSTAVKFGDPIRMQLGMKLFIMNYCCCCRACGKYLQLSDTCQTHGLRSIFGCLLLL